MKTVLIAASVVLLSGPALGQPMRWGHGAEMLHDGVAPRVQRAEGKVSVETFVADGAEAAALGRGGIAVVEVTPEAGSPEDAALPVYAAAVLDRLVARGYDSTVARSDAGQITEVRLVRDVAVPEEGPRKPVSGAMQTTVSNHGNSFGMALGIDLTKPRKALLSTRLEARIRDAGTRAVLWEGHAEMLSREESGRWTDQAIAAKLADALFRDFPRAGASNR
jgi:hypothetical protein